MTEKWYVYKSNRDDDGWRQRRIEATSPDRTIGMSVEWSLLMSDGFGYGVTRKKWGWLQ